MSDTALVLGTADFLHLVHVIVRDRGADFVYPEIHDAGPSCRYDSANGCRCLIGEVAHRSGVPEATLTEWTDDPDTSGPVDMLCADGRISTDSRTQKLMTLAQRMQDSGIPYGTLQDILTYAEDLM